MLSYRGLNEESINLKSPSLMWGPGSQCVRLVRCSGVSSIESRAEFSAVASEINKLPDEESLLCLFI